MDPSGNRIIRYENLVSMLGAGGLRHCTGGTTSISEGQTKSSRKGLVTTITIRCDCDKGWFHCISDPSEPKDNSINIQSMVSMRTVGKGLSSLNTFCGFMNLPLPFVAQR